MPIFLRSRTALTISLSLFTVSMCAPVAHADLASDIKALREAHNEFVKRYTAPDEEFTGRPPAPTVWGGRVPENSCRGAWGTVGAFLDKAEEAQRESRDWEGSAAFGFSADSSGTTQKSKGSIDAKFGVGQYPDQFRLEAGTSLDFDNKRSDEISEDVTRILLNYDHYFGRHYEGFGFIERFTDTFMSLDQRYEIGMGLKLEWTAGARPEKLEKREKFEKATDALRTLLTQSPEGPRKCVVNTQWKPFDMPKDLLSSSKSNVLYEALDHASARIEYGISAAVLADFEQADTLTFNTQIGTAAAVEQKFKPDGTQRYRLSVRPSITWYITDEVSLDARFFYKPALDSPRRVAGQRDYRMDANAKLKWKFGSIKAGSDLKTALVLSYDWHYDSVPPNADAFLPTLGVPLDQIIVTGRSVAEKRHSLIKLQLEVGL